ncbi:hypothetical protein I302_103786 [Kwoniella bestiolae CBS 10118]|uniref:Fork-head domain-containing protein n=1 Tax=Kwoniella bestiolae CBS 10118 TaxID=1296100 RepID=A0A1B9G9F5_9TREE|nr:hypothetical protein I302_02490 [Kwoniella bestiolae CBS 10118]OCF27646.1 hypothetical protein I302_02490 [Kwoniella bestiolae CBS 10118]
MSRPASSTSQRPSGSGSNNMMGGESMGRVHTFSPTPSASTSHQPIYYTHEQIISDGYIQPYNSYGGEINGQMITPYAGHQVAQGRIAIPMHGHPGNVMAINQNHPGRGAGKTPIRATPPPNNGFDDLGPSPFLPEEETTPYLPAHFEAYGQMSVSPSMGPMQLSQQNHLVSPTDQINMGRMAPPLHRNNTMPLLSHQQQHFQSQPLPMGRQRQNAQQGRPAIIQRQQSMPGPIQRPTALSRHASIHGPSRSASPHIGGDIFDPVPPGANGSPLMRGQMHPLPPAPENMDMSWDLSSFDPAFNPTGQGISPARALGPAPHQPQRFSPHREAHIITPQNNKLGYNHQIHSSAVSVASTATTSSSISSMSDISVRSAHQQIKQHDGDSSDDEHESPTRGPSTSRAMMKMHLEEKKNSGDMPRMIKQIPKSTATGGRTSAKFAKVAEDPGVEGVPPGPRPMERPSPSFACIIGQAILRCKAGGLSLEHIYRYVETAYPFFKNGDGAWRNSVRHNLSIHKMFETIPRTEMFPPGKGGIWIIHEDEKCHWPAEDKFIKNFPPSHPHHAVCRQTLHERAKENEAIEKAAREGRVYVPKKGKKGRKLAAKDEDDDEGSTEMIRTSSMLTEIPLQRTESQQDLAGSSTPIPEAEPEDESTTPRVKFQLLEPPPLNHQDSSEAAEFEDDEGEFLPIEADLPDPAPVDVTPADPVRKRDEQMARNGMMMPPRFERKEKRRPLEVEDDNVFTSTKRVRVADPLAPIHPLPQEASMSVKELDDSFITPERERPISNNKSIMSSAFKTPALIQTSSSPGSSPMPSTITRSTHHPSALQQTWTHDDMAENHPHSRESSPRPMLDAAFDFKPKAPPPRARTLAQEDDYPPSKQTHHHSPRAPPKTPVSRSSAATDKTPRLQHLRTPSLAKTPMFFGGSPALPPPSASAFLSTPMWEVGGVLDRLKDHLTGSPTHSTNSGSIRSPMPSTDPTRYAMLLDSGGSPRKRRDVSL